MQDITKSFEDVHLDAKIYWILPETLWNSTTVVMLRVMYTRLSHAIVLSSQTIFFYVYHNFFSLFRSKARQKTKNWKFLCIFSPGLSPLKFYYIKHVCEMKLLRKFKFFSIFSLQNYTFFFWIWILYEKCVLLRYIMLI